jgi:hypothetical protein
LELDDVDYSLIIYHTDYEYFDDLDCGQYHYAMYIYDNVFINGYNEDEDYIDFGKVSSKEILQHYEECSWNDYYNIDRNNYIREIITKFYIDFTNDLREE